MKLETLRDRLAKAEEKITKKQATIAKKENWIAKKTAAMEKLSDQEQRWAEWDIESLQDDIKRIRREIEETRKTIENYKAQIAGETERQNLLTTEVPELLKKMQTELVEGWDEYDKRRRDQMKKDFREMDYNGFLKKYRGQNTDFRNLTDDEIHAGNLRDAEDLILNLINRVKGITGEITSWNGIRATAGAQGYTVLNGRVEGKEGIAYVESIGAGGYNIQRYHIRVLIKALS